MASLFANEAISKLGDLTGTCHPVALTVLLTLMSCTMPRPILHTIVMIADKMYQDHVMYVNCCQQITQLAVPQ